VRLAASGIIQKFPTRPERHFLQAEVAHSIFSYFIPLRDESRVSLSLPRTGSEAIHAVAAVNGGPLPFTERSSAENERKTRGAKCWSSDHCASCKMTLPALVSPPRAGHMYPRGWTKVEGDIMEAGGRTDGRRGLSVPHV